MGQGAPTPRRRKGSIMGMGDLVNKAKGLAEKGKDVAGDIADKAKHVAGNIAEDAKEVKDIAKGEGSIGDKAKAAVEAIKDPGAPDPKEPGPG